MTGLETLVALLTVTTIALFISVILLIIQVIGLETKVTRIFRMQISDREVGKNVYRLFRSLRDYAETIAESVSLTQEHTTMVHDKLVNFMDETTSKEKTTKRKTTKKK